MSASGALSAHEKLPGNDMFHLVIVVLFVRMVFRRVVAMSTASIIQCGLILPEFCTIRLQQISNFYAEFRVEGGLGPMVNDNFSKR